MKITKALKDSGLTQARLDILEKAASQPNGRFFTHGLQRVTITDLSGAGYIEQALANTPERIEQLEGMRDKAIGVARTALNKEDDPTGWERARVALGNAFTYDQQAKERAWVISEKGRNLFKERG